MSERIIAACGNDCSVCPRYNAGNCKKTSEELHKTAVLWEKIGYRDHVVTNEEISCSGCKVDNWCRYSVISCVNNHEISNCGECSEYPCDNIRECFKVTSSFEPKIKEVCALEEYEILKKAFFEKEQNLNNGR